MTNAIITPAGVTAAVTAPETVNDAYVEADERVLDLTALSGSLLDRMPQPTGWRLLILPYRGKGLTSGGIALSKKTVDEDQIQTVVGYVLKMGPLAYQEKEKFSSGPWCKEKDWIIFPRYAGSRFKIEGGEVRVLNDDEVIATITDPDDILSF